MNDIAESDLMDIPHNCQGCNSNLYGIVKFCPYCGESVASKEEPEDDLTLPAKQMPDESHVKSTRVVHGPENEKMIHNNPVLPETVEASPVPLTNGEDSDNDVVTTSNDSVERKEEDVTSASTTKSWVTTVQENKLVVGLLILLVLGGGSATSYYLLNGLEKMAGDVLSSASPDEPSALAGGQRDAARIRALDTLRAGTDLSVRLTQLPKLEKVLSAAQKLLEVSPRYQDEVNTSIANLESVQKDRDNKLLSYIGLLSELGRHTQDDLSYALHIVGSDELTDREKKVLALLNTHLVSVRDGSQADPRRVLVDFSQVFDDFVE